MTSPNPTKLRLQLMPDIVDKYKKVDCQSYEDCLSSAARAGWSQFKCTQCKAYKKEEKIISITNLDDFIKNLNDK